MVIMNHGSRKNGPYRGTGISKGGVTDRAVSVWLILFSFVLAVLFMMDILSTQLILGMGGVELNPVMAGIVTIPAPASAPQMRDTLDGYSRCPRCRGPGERIGCGTLCGTDCHVHIRHH